MTIAGASEHERDRMAHDACPGAASAQRWRERAPARPTRHSRRQPAGGSRLTISAIAEADGRGARRADRGRRRARLRRDRAPARRAAQGAGAPLHRRRRRGRRHRPGDVLELLADRRRAGSRADRRLAAYLTRIAINRAIDGDRRRRVRRFFGLEEADEVADPEPAARRPARRQAANWRRWRATSRPCRRASARRSCSPPTASGRTPRSATAMGLSVGAVEQLLVRARRTLRMRLAERDG